MEKISKIISSFHPPCEAIQILESAVPKDGSRN